MQIRHEKNSLKKTAFVVDSLTIHYLNQYYYVTFYIEKTQLKDIQDKIDPFKIIIILYDCL
jgi:hypothetical protein